MEFKHYAEAPKNVAEAIITARASDPTTTVESEHQRLKRGHESWPKASSSEPSRT
jgi:hypothetical protein